MNSWLWTGDELTESMGGYLVGGSLDGVSGISIDTRTLMPGEAYFAIRGDVHDGHKFVSNAKDAGASVSVVSEEKLSTLSENCGCLIVQSKIAN